MSPAGSPVREVRGLPRSCISQTPAWFGGGHGLRHRHYLESLRSGLDRSSGGRSLRPTRRSMRRSSSHVSTEIFPCSSGKAPTSGSTLVVIAASATRTSRSCLRRRWQRTRGADRSRVFSTWQGRRRSPSGAAPECLAAPTPIPVEVADLQGVRGRPRSSPPRKRVPSLKRGLFLPSPLLALIEFNGAPHMPLRCAK